MDTQVLTTIDTDGIGRLRQRGLVAAVAGLVVGAVGVLMNPGQLAPSLLIGFWFCTGLSLGSLALLMLQHMTGGQYGLVSRRIWEAAARLLPLSLVLFLPVAFLAPHLYVWARPEGQAVHAIAHRGVYATQWFFTVRGVPAILSESGCSPNSSRLEMFSTAMSRPFSSTSSSISSRMMLRSTSMSVSRGRVSMSPRMASPTSTCAGCRGV